jgi:DNA-binding MarR family transcriptional regulator
MIAKSMVYCESRRRGKAVWVKQGICEADHSGKREMKRRIPKNQNRSPSRPVRNSARKHKGDPSLAMGLDYDIADFSIEVWRRERPDLDASGKAIAGRILRLSEMLLGQMNQNMARIGIKYSIYAIVATLRTSGAPTPYQMSPTQLKSALLVTSGGISNLLNEAERAGLIRRISDPDDGRGVLVELTEAGHKLSDIAMPMQAELEQTCIQMLSSEEKEVLARLLKKMILRNRAI